MIAPLEEADEADEGSEEGRDGESTAQLEGRLLLVRQYLETMEETMVTGEEGWDRGGRRGRWGGGTGAVGTGERWAQWTGLPLQGGLGRGEKGQVDTWSQETKELMAEEAKYRREQRQR